MAGVSQRGLVRACVFKSSRVMAGVNDLVVSGRAK